MKQYLLMLLSCANIIICMDDNEKNFFETHKDNRNFIVSLEHERNNSSFYDYVQEYNINITEEQSETIKTNLINHWKKQINWQDKIEDYTIYTGTAIMAVEVLATKFGFYLEVPFFEMITLSLTRSMAPYILYKTYDEIIKPLLCSHKSTKQELLEAIRVLKNN